MNYSSLILLLSGLFSGMLFLSFSTRTKTLVSIKLPKVVLILNILIIIASIYLFTIPFENLIIIVEKYPVNFQKPTGSDIIPQVGILVERLLEGDFPYQPIDKDDWDRSFTLFPTYLPIQWLPYIGAQLLDMDYRIYAFIIFVLLILYFVVRNIRVKSNILSTLVLGILPPLILIGFMSNDYTGGFRHSVELLIVAYYMFLASTIVRFNWKVISIIVAICLLSRYSIVLWVPLFFFVLYRKLGLRIVFRSISIMFILFCIFYLPFLIKDPMIFFKGYDYHTNAAVGAWKMASWQPSTDTVPYSLKHGVGMAVFFYENISGDIVERLTTLRYSHLGLCLGSIILLGFWYFKNENRILPGVFLLGSLKIYLVVFYNFIQIPFIYLFWVLPMISVVMFAVLINTRKLKDDSTTT